MNRFSSKNRFFQKFHIQYLFVIFSVVILVTFFYGIQTLGTVTKDKQKESLENTLHRCIVHCYAVEGTYPPSLDYLNKHYGFIYDENKFFIDYTSIGSNLIPDVTIIEKGE